MAIVEELKKIGGGTGSTIEEALATGDFGGGSGGVFIVNVNVGEHAQLDKTWKEIYDAYMDGKKVIASEQTDNQEMHSAVYSTVLACAFADLADSSHVYSVVTLADGSITPFITDSESGYPIFE